MKHIQLRRLFTVLTISSGAILLSLNTQAALTGTYDVTFTASDSSFGPTSLGPITATVGSISSGSIYFPGAFPEAYFETVLKADGSLVVSMLALDALQFNFPIDASIVLTAIDLADGGVMSPIANVAFDAAKTNIVQFNDAANFDGPALAFTADSITIGFSYYNGEIAADGPFLYFDVMTAPVPIPAAVWLFGSGLIGLIGVARRKKT